MGIGLLKILLNSLTLMLLLLDEEAKTETKEEKKEGKTEDL